MHLSMQATASRFSIRSTFGLFIQTLIVQVTIKALSVLIFVLVYGRMIEVYLMTSLAPIPLRPLITGSRAW